MMSLVALFGIWYCWKTLNESVVHQVGFIMFQLTMQNLLNIEQFFTQISFKSKLKVTGEFGHTLDILGKPSIIKI